MMNLSSLSQSINKQYSLQTPIGVDLLVRKLESYKKELQTKLHAPPEKKISKHEKVERLKMLIEEGGIMTAMLKSAAMVAHNASLTESLGGETDRAFVFSKKLPVLKAHFDFIDFI